MNATLSDMAATFAKARETGMISGPAPHVKRGQKRRETRLSEQPVADQDPSALPGPVFLDKRGNTIVLKILAGIAEAHGYNVPELITKRRDDHRAHTRFLAMFISSEITGCPDSEIGAVFQRDRTDVIHGRRWIVDQATVNLRFREQLLRWMKWAKTLTP